MMVELLQQGSGISMSYNSAGVNMVVSELQALTMDPVKVVDRSEAA